VVGWRGGQLGFWSIEPETEQLPSTHSRSPSPPAARPPAQLLACCPGVRAGPSDPLPSAALFRLHQLPPPAAPEDELLILRRCHASALCSPLPCSTIYSCSSSASTLALLLLSFAIVLASFSPLLSVMCMCRCGSTTIIVVFMLALY